MKEEIWNLFLKTGNIETYLLLKQLEGETLDNYKNENIIRKQEVTLNTKI